jgi:hypothetical protein
MVNLLAFLVCAKASVDESGRLTLHELFDGLAIQRSGSFRPQFPKWRVFFVFYKVIADTPCTVMLRVAKPSGEEIPGDWSHSITAAVGEPSTWQSLWALSTDPFQEPGLYQLELLYSHGGQSTRYVLASTHLLVQVNE